MWPAILSAEGAESRAGPPREPGLRRTRELAGWVRRRGRELVEAVGGTHAVGPGEAPLPPVGHRARVGVPGRYLYVEAGLGDARVIAAAATAAGLEVSEVGQVLDFGCGAGRVLRHLDAPLPRARLTGCDVDAEAIGWAQRHLPQLSVRVTGFEPPLPFAAATFELIYSVSVFSHLNAELQDRWLAELSRVLTGGGLALLSVHGESAFEAFRGGAVQSSWCRPQAFVREPLADHEFVFEPYCRSPLNRRELSATGSGYGLAFHGRGYLTEHWSRYLEVVEVHPRAFSDWQDLVVCRRSDGRRSGGLLV